MNSWLAALRIARREARRARGRSLLVVVMIMLPVLGLAFAAVSYDMFTLKLHERADRELGAADASFVAELNGPIHQAPNGVDWTVAGEITRPGGFETDGDQVRRHLPAGSRAIPYRETLMQVRTATGIGGITARGLDARDPLARGVVVTREGRVPERAHETALSEPAARRTGLSVGDRLRLADGSRSYAVVGIVEFPDSLREHALVLPDAPVNWSDHGWLVDAPGPVTWEQVKRLNEVGILVVSRAVLLDPPPDRDVPFFQSRGDVDDQPLLTMSLLVGGLAALEVVLLAGPAFAVGARRRQRDLALVAANGGTPAHLRRIVLADGVVLGLAAGVVGIVLGIAVAFAGRPLVEEYLTHYRAGGYRVWPLALAAIAGLAVGVGVLAALVPAFTAARQSVVAALTGRRGLVRSRKRWVALGLALTALGGVVAWYGARRGDSRVILSGLIAGQLGLVLCTPALVGLISRAGRVLPLAPRIALRDTARNRAAAAPAISAVMAAVAGALAIGIFMDSRDAQWQSQVTPVLPVGHAAIVLDQVGQGEATVPDPARRPVVERLSQVIRDSLPVDRMAPVSMVACPAGTKNLRCEVHVEIPPQRQCPYMASERPLTAAEKKAAREDERCAYISDPHGGTLFDRAVVDDGTALPLLTKADADDLAAAAAVLRAGGVVVHDTHRRYVVNGTVKVTATRFDTTNINTPATTTSATLPGYALTSGVNTFSAVVSPAALARLGLDATPAGVLASTTRMPSQAEEDRFRAAVQASSDGESTTLQRPHKFRENPMLVILAYAAGVVTLGAAGAATGLAAADGRRDLSTLAAVGASPRVRRMLSLSQSGVIAGLGAVLGTLAGVGAAFAVLFALNQANADLWPGPAPYPIRVPWETLGVLLVVPLVAMLGAGLLTRSRLPIERRLD